MKWTKNKQQADLPSKGRIKSKWFFQADVSFQITNEWIRLYYYETSSFCSFLEEIKDTTKTFRN